jgi:hypothetical protein
MKITLLFALALIAILPIALQAQSPNYDGSLVNDLYEARTCRRVPIPDRFNPSGDRSSELECTFELPGLRFEITTGPEDEGPFAVTIHELRADSRYRLTAVNDCVLVRYEREVGDPFYDPERSVRLVFLDRYTGAVGTATDGMDCLYER